MERPPDDGPREDDWLQEDWLEAPTEETPRPSRRPPGPPSLRNPDRRVVAAVAAAALVLIIILAVTLGGDGDDQTGQTTPVVTSTEPTTGTATEPAPSLQVPEGGALSQGDSGRRVRLLQRALAELGYDVSPDGEYGPATSQAVSAFQRDAGLEVDGVAGADTIAAVNAALANQEA